MARWISCLAVMVFLVVAPAISWAICEGHCGDRAPQGCWCDDECAEYGDCCEDVCDVCEFNCPDASGGGGSDKSCEGICNDEAPSGCWCDANCVEYGDCCSDVCDWCGLNCPDETGAESGDETSAESGESGDESGETAESGFETGETAESGDESGDVEDSGEETAEEEESGESGEDTSVDGEGSASNPHPERWKGNAVLLLRADSSEEGCSSHFGGGVAWHWILLWAAVLGGIRRGQTRGREQR